MRTRNNKQKAVLLSRGYTKERLQGKVFVIPSFITVLSLFSGFLALMSAINGHYEYATKCIALAIIMDGLDGRVARRLNATTAFGREFDSLSDVCAFGVAPAVLIYEWGFRPIADEFGVLVSFIFVVCGATRLARFNVTTSDEPKSHFTGLPIPGAAAAIASVIYAYPFRLENEWVVALMCFYTLLIAFLMVSTIPFFSVKRIKLTQDNQKYYLIALAILVALTWKYSRFVIFVGSTVYALSGPAQYLIRGARPAARNQVTAPPDDVISGLS